LSHGSLHTGETGSAVDRPSLSRTKRDSRLGSTGGARDGDLNTVPRRAACDSLVLPSLAGFAPLGFVPQSLVGKKELLASSENKLLTAVHTPEGSIGVFRHRKPPRFQADKTFLQRRKGVPQRRPLLQLIRNQLSTAAAVEPLRPGLQSDLRYLPATPLLLTDYPPPLENLPAIIALLTLLSSGLSVAQTPDFRTSTPGPFIIKGAVLHDGSVVLRLRSWQPVEQLRLSGKKVWPLRTSWGSIGRLRSPKQALSPPI
jgi:hypothetical protein